MILKPDGNMFLLLVQSLYSKAAKKAEMRIHREANDDGVENGHSSCGYLDLNNFPSSFYPSSLKSMRRIEKWKDYKV